MHRVVVINDDAIESGGAAAIALASARLLRERGIPVTFLSGDAGGIAALALEGIDVAVLGGRHILDGSRAAAALRGLYDPATRAALREWIAANDTPGTVYHLHNWHKLLSPSVFQPLRGVADRLVMSAHDYFLACPNGGYFDYPRQAPCSIRAGSLRCIATDCDRRHYGHKLWRLARHRVRELLFDPQALNTVVLTVHEGMVPHFVSAGVDGRNIRTLRNPVTPWRTDRVPAERNRDAFFVGRLDEDKGVDLLAQAARQAGVPLELIGDGPLATPLARAYPEIRQHGWQPPGRISELIGSARLLVLPTRCRETFGLVALEAAMSGIPVVVSPFAAIGGEVVRHGFGCVADPYDQEAFAGLLRDLAKDDRTVEEMSWRAFANARALAPTPARWCDDLLQLYAERLGGVGCKPPTRSEPRGQTRAQTDDAAAMRIHEIG